MEIFTVFHCPKDNYWGVSKWDPKRKIYIGVADLPDEKTARAVKHGLELRDQLNRITAEHIDAVGAPS